MPVALLMVFPPLPPVGVSVPSDSMPSESMGTAATALLASFVMKYIALAGLDWFEPFPDLP